MTQIQDCQTSCYSLEIKESLAVLHFFGDIFELGTCLEEKKSLLSLVRTLNDSTRIRVLLLLNSPGVLGDKEYACFISRAIRSRGVGGEYNDHAASASGFSLERMNNALNHLILEMMEFRKLIICGFEGDVASPFFGVGLGADYRFASEEMTFQPSHYRLGLPPGGGLGFFLPRFVDQVQVREFLFSGEPIPARNLYRLGLLDGCFPSAGFRGACIEVAIDLAQMPMAVISGVKSILNFHTPSLRDFLKYEENAMMNTIERHPIRRDLPTI